MAPRTRASYRTQDDDHSESDVIADPLVKLREQVLSAEDDKSNTSIDVPEHIKAQVYKAWNKACMICGKPKPRKLGNRKRVPPKDNIYICHLLARTPLADNEITWVHSVGFKYTESFNKIRCGNLIPLCYHHHDDFDNRVFMLSYKAEVLMEIICALVEKREPCFDGLPMDKLVYIFCTKPGAASQQVIRVGDYVQEYQSLKETARDARYPQVVDYQYIGPNLELGYHGEIKPRPKPEDPDAYPKVDVIFNRDEENQTLEIELDISQVPLDKRPNVVALMVKCTDAANRAHSMPISCVSDSTRDIPTGDNLKEEKGYKNELEEITALLQIFRYLVNQGCFKKATSAGLLMLKEIPQQTLERLPTLCRKVGLEQALKLPPKQTDIVQDADDDVVPSRSQHSKGKGVDRTALPGTSASDAEAAAAAEGTVARTKSKKGRKAGK
ncbi:hypothetical protein ONZ51_g3108 [Trametes cubensis]|uniref:Uncharacterized protein n=1 Tax=Trametes cubensis TaxID=1111947 RepID=A0AAD7XE75_9APHY|nr:hypothetical protein ONZ51_g3108 [Trametes cubensis]